MGQRSGTVRAVALSGVCVLLLSGLTACFSDSRPGPEDTLGALATAIGTGDYSAVPLTPDSADVPDELTEALAELEEFRALASAGDPVVSEEDEDAATAPLTVTWDLGADTPPDTEGPDAGPATPSTASPSASAGSAGPEWTYSTEVQLRWDEESEQWRVELTPDTVVEGLEAGQEVRVARTPAVRGAILDGDGDELMMERDVVVLGLDKAQLAASLQSEGSEGSEGSAAEDEELAEAVRDSAIRVAEAAGVSSGAFADRAEAAGDSAFVAALTLRNNGDTEIPWDEVAEIPGGRILEDTAVLAPTRTWAQDILGSFGEPSAEQVEASDGALEPGVAVGLSGLQADWQEELAGTPGLEITLAASEAAAGAEQDQEPETVFTSEPVDGQDVTSTLDRRIQNLAQRVVAAQDVPAGLVVVRPSDGHVLAAASGPEGWRVSAAGSYAPGSTFKVVTSLALLRDGLAPEDTVSCPETVTVDGLVIGNYDGYPAGSVGQIPFSEAFAESCNTVFVGAHDEVTAEQEAQAARDLGLVPEPRTGLSSAFLGSVPEDSTGTEHAANLFGQGVVEASPLGMATVAASVAAGHTVHPLFVADPAVGTAPGEDAEAPESPAGTTSSPTAEASTSAAGAGVTEEEAAALRELMAGVVQDGTAEMLQDVPGEPILAKTGTAQFVADGEDLAHTWLIAIQGDLAVALFLNEGLGGGHDNGPIVRDFLTDIAGLADLG